MLEHKENARLPRNFHKTFKPERQYVNAMLKYAASGREGDSQEIGSATGIPTGASSGKVPAILDYCRGMGLVHTGHERSAVKKPELTPFGRIVLLEDPYLKAGITQWIAHFNLCGPITGADVWYQTFFCGMPSLGMSFDRNQLDAYLSSVYGVEKAGLVGPMIGMYEDDAAFRTCGVLAEMSGRISRKPAPVSDEFGFAYGAWMLQQMSDHLPGVGHVPVTELEKKAGWRTIPGWEVGSHQRVLELIERKGLIEVDRHMEPWLLRPAAAVVPTWRRIYDDLL
jgi:hypothetical protein